MTAAKARAKPSPKKVQPKKAATSKRVDGLLPKQAKFVAEYLLCGNATQAAIRAGYSPKTAYSIGQENLKKPEIAAKLQVKQSAIAARQDAVLEKMELTDERIKREIARLAYADPRKLFAADGSPIPIQDLDDDTAAAITGIEVQEQYEGTGRNRRFIGLVKKYKLTPKGAPLDMAAKIRGLYERDNEQSRPTAHVVIVPAKDAS